MAMNKIKKDYRGFVLHVESWNNLGIPYGLGDLVFLAKKYNTPIFVDNLKNIKENY